MASESSRSQPLATQLSLGAARAARVLDALAKKRWSLSALSRELDVERRTLGRVVGALESEGFVARDRAGRLAPGPNLVSTARTIVKESGLVAIAAEVVDNLAQATGCTTMLHQAHGDYLLPEVIKTPVDAVAVVFPPGRSIELWRGIGRAYLAHCRPADIRRIGSMSPREDFDEVLRREREAGFSVSLGELVPGITAIGAPVFDGPHVIAVLAVVGFDPGIPHLHADVLKGAAARLSRLVGEGRER